MAYYIKNSAQVQAIRIPEIRPNMNEYSKWFRSARSVIEGHDIWITTDGLAFCSSKGNMVCRWGNWIIRETNNEIYSCEHNIFITSYKEVK